MKKGLALLMTLAMVTSLAACGSKQETPDAAAPSSTSATEETTSQAAPSTDGIPASVTLSDSTILQGKKIGCAICYKGDEWCAAVAGALEKLGSYYGCEIVVEDGDLNDETMTKQIENMIANNCDMLFIDPTTPEGTTQALNKAYDARIPILIYD